MHREAWRAAAHGVTKNRIATDLNRTEYSIVYMYHNFFSHSTVDGHLGCFRVLAIVNRDAMNNVIHVSFSILFSTGYKPRSGIAGSYVPFIPIFKESPYHLP